MFWLLHKYCVCAIIGLSGLPNYMYHQWSWLVWLVNIVVITELFVLLFASVFVTSDNNIDIVKVKDPIMKWLEWSQKVYHFERMNKYSSNWLNFKSIINIYPMDQLGHYFHIVHTRSWLVTSHFRVNSFKRDMIQTHVKWLKFIFPIEITSPVKWLEFISLLK